MRLPWPRSRIGKAALAAAAAGGLLLIGSAGYYEASGEKFCGHCHELSEAIDSWRGATHRAVACKGCHGDILTLDPDFHLMNFRRVWAHLRGEVPHRLLLKDEGVDALQERCRSCHQGEWADWAAGPHGISYGKFLLNEANNKVDPPTDDCLRCHGMYFAGRIGDLVKRSDAEGRWSIVPAGAAERAAIPCLACHQVHHPGEPRGALAKTGPAASGPSSAGATPRADAHRPSLGFFDRRGQRHIPAGQLTLPAMREGARMVQVSPDPRQGICYQCHAPAAGARVATGDDRTPIGVHEGISCLACHPPHGGATLPSCATCHPRLSNCGLPVETMDTTFRSADSKHDVHRVKCEDCHPGGAPQKKKKV
jgi:cytochrome c554/c'-like protein